MAGLLNEDLLRLKVRQIISK